MKKILFSFPAFLMLICLSIVSYGQASDPLANKPDTLVYHISSLHKKKQVDIKNVNQTAEQYDSPATDINIMLNRYGGKYKGHIIYKKSIYSYKMIRMSRNNDSVVFVKVLKSKLLCVDYISGMPQVSAAVAVTPVPVYNSNPAAPYVIFLDFDGGTLNNPNWFNTSISLAASGFTPDVILDICRRVGTGFAPFNINVTTDSAVYLSCIPAKRFKTMVTPTWQWYGVAAGGVSFVGSFGYDVYGPNFVFTVNLSNKAEYIAEAILHENGHAAGLQHHGQFDNTCKKTGNYHNGNGKWGPVMGAPYGMPYVQWAKGPTTASTCSAITQDDLSVITKIFPYRTDDKSNTPLLSVTLNLSQGFGSDSGIIESNSDVDYYKVFLAQQTTASITLRPYSPAGTLLPALRILNDAGNLISIDTPATAIINRTITLNAGTSYFEVSSRGFPYFTSNGYTTQYNYGSIGQYYISVSVPTGPSVDPCKDFKIELNSYNFKICKGGSVTVTASGANNYAWLPVSGLNQNTASSVTATPLVNTTYTVTGSGANNCTASANCTVTVLSNMPALITPAATAINSGQSAQLSAPSGYAYLWNTGETKQSILVSPATATTYTLKATDANGCTSSSNSVVTINPPPPNCAVPVSQLFLFNVSVNSVIVGFSKNTSTCYNVSVSPLPANPIPAVQCQGACAFTLTGLKSKTKYTVRINNGKEVSFTTK